MFNKVPCLKEILKVELNIGSQWQDRWFESSLGTMMMMLVKQPACSFLCACLSFIISVMTVVEFHSKAGGIQ